MNIDQTCGQSTTLIFTLKFHQLCTSINKDHINEIYKYLKTRKYFCTIVTTLRLGNETLPYSLNQVPPIEHQGSLNIASSLSHQKRNWHVLQASTWKLSNTSYISNLHQNKKPTSCEALPFTFTCNASIISTQNITRQETFGVEKDDKVDTCRLVKTSTPNPNSDFVRSSYWNSKCTSYAHGY